MNLLMISFFCVLEVAMLLLVFGVVLKRKNKRLQRRICELERPAEPAESFESIESGYLPYLEKQVIDTRSRLELNEIETGVDDELAAALANRLDFLEREKRVVELCNDYPKRRWEHVSECFCPPQEEGEPFDEEADVAPDDASEAPEAEFEEPVVQLAGILNRQGDALESFRQVFEVIKKEPDLQALEQMEKALRELERRYREASTCIEIMEQENQRLQNKVEQGGRRLERAEAEKNENIVDLQDQVGKQKRNISELNHLIDNLQLEAEHAAELQAKIDQFDLATRDMNMCIQIMEEENEFLREQVQALLQLDVDGSANENNEDQVKRIEELQHEIESLQAELKARNDSIATIEDKYASMEKEYLTLYEKSQS